MEERRIVPKKKTEDKISEAAFFTYFMYAKVTAHILHLQSDSFAEHIALDEFYKGSQENADAIIEIYQGATQSKVQYDTKVAFFGLELKALDYLLQLREIIENNRYLIVPKEMTNVHNEIDNFVSTLDQSAYKIKFLK